MLFLPTPYNLISLIDDFQFDGILQVISKNWCRLNILDPIKKAEVKNQTIPLNHIYIKPYLRPLSSMTEEESAELSNIMNEWFDKELFDLIEEPFLEHALEQINYSINPLLFDWLNKKMFDFRGLIDKDLTLSTETFNPYKD